MGMTGRYDANKNIFRLGPLGRGFAGHRLGQYGVLRRAEITSFSDNLSSELMRLNTEVVQMENLTQRLSDEYLDIDLLDERVREILGYVRSSELVVN